MQTEISFLATSTSTSQCFNYHSTERAQKRYNKISITIMHQNDFLTYQDSKCHQGHFLPCRDPSGSVIFNLGRADSGESVLGGTWNPGKQEIDNDIDIDILL